MKDLEVITIGQKDYCIVKEVDEESNHYVFLSNIVNPSDIMIRKSTIENPDYFVPLENEDEYYLANLLLFKDTCEQ